MNISVVGTVRTPTDERARTRTDERARTRTDERERTRTDKGERTRTDEHTACACPDQVGTGGVAVRAGRVWRVGVGECSPLHSSFFSCLVTLIGDWFPVGSTGGSINDVLGVNWEEITPTQTKREAQTIWQVVTLPQEDAEESSRY